VQIDHVIPLTYAWRAGAWRWTDAQREAFSNDPANLQTVHGPTNNRKGGRGPSSWLPPAETAHCGYAASWEQVAARYALTLDPADTAALDDVTT
jgi:hypothetical protein